MSNQPSLFDPTPPPPPIAARRVLRDEAPPAAFTPPTTSLDEQFAAFLDANPWITEQIIDICRQLRARGFERYGIGAIVEHIRFDRILTLGDDGSGFRVNNNVRSRLARHVMAEAPDLEGFFAVRALRAA